MTVDIIFFTDFDCQYAVKNEENKLVCVDTNGDESPFMPNSNTFVHFNYLIEKVKIPEGSKANDVIIARLKMLVELNKNLPVSYNR